MKKLTTILRNSTLALALCGFAAPAFAAPEKVTGWGDFKLFLDPGHSGRENQGMWGYSEAEKVLAVALSIEEYLTTYTDIPAENLQLCRHSISDQVGLQERSDMANAWGADFFYSIHSDASATENTTVTLFGGWMKDGVETEKTPKGGKAFGEILNPELTNVMRIKTRGNWYDRCYYQKGENHHQNQYPYLSVNRESNMASLLSEGGYHTIAAQQQLNINDEYKRIEALAAFRSILKYRGIKCPAQTVLAGIIRNSENNVPINGVTVTVAGKTYTTDTYETRFHKYTSNPNLIHNGFYYFENLEPGEYEVKYEAKGFDPVTKKVTVKSAPEKETIENVTYVDLAMVNNSPAVVESNSIEKPDAVSPVYPVVLTFSRNMDRASVEKAISINNNGKIALTWINDFTLSIDISQLMPLFTYELTIDGSVAKNSQTNQLLDGDGDGVAGGNYVLTFTMAEPDVTAPIVKSTYPTADGEALCVKRAPIRIEFDERLLWNEDKHMNTVALEDASGKQYTGKVTHEVVRNASVVHFYPTEDFPIDKCMKVTVKPGVTDMSGNVFEGYEYRFLTEYRPMVSEETVLPIDGIDGFWAPSGSGSTQGVDKEGSTFTSAAAPTFSIDSPKSAKLTYVFDEFATTSIWQIRLHHPGGSTDHQTIDGVISFWVYGDGSNNKVGALFRCSNKTGGTLVFKDPLDVIDFRGWKLVTFDMKNDGTAVFAGDPNKGLVDKWRFDAFYVVHENTDPDDPDVPFQEWTGEIYFDEMQFNKYDDTATRTAKLDDIKLSGVEAVEAEGLTVVVDGNVLNVNATSDIESVLVYAANGTVVANAAPAAETAAIAVDALANGVYVATVKTADAVKTVKFVK